MKKFRRFFTVLLAVLLMACLLPFDSLTAYAYTDWGKDGTGTSGNNGACQHLRTHQVAVKKTCTKPGYIKIVCDLCGETLGIDITDSDIVGHHTWSKWVVDKAASCTTSGSQHRTCSVCGAKETEKLSALGHYSKEWKIIKEATDHSKGEREGACIRCGKKIHEEYYPEGTLKPGDVGKKVKELQEALVAAGYDPGKIDGAYGPKTEEAVKQMEKDMGLPQDGIAWPAVQAALKGVKNSLKLEVKLLSKESGMMPNDKINIAWKITNSGKNALTEIKLMCNAGGKTMTFYDGGKMVLQSGKSISGEWKTALSEKTYNAYFEEGSIVFKLVAGGRDKHKEKVRSGLCEVKFTLGSETDTKEDPEEGGKKGPEKEEWTPPVLEDKVSLVKKVVSNPSLGYYVEGDVIEYELTFTNNTGVTLSKLRLLDPLYIYMPDVEKGNPANWGKYTDVKDGDVIKATLYYHVTGDDVSKGKVVNTCGALFEIDGENKYISGNDVTVDTGKVKETGSVVLEKKVTSIPGVISEYYVEGEKVEYTITVTNNTDEDLTDVEIVDPLKGSNEDSVVTLGETIPAGKSLSASFTHEVTYDEALAGKIYNHATVSWAGNEEGSFTNTVIVLTGIYGGVNAEVTKEITSYPKNGKFYTVGEKIEYKVTVTNNGKETLKDLYVIDGSSARSEVQLLDAIVSLAPGETREYNYSYEVEEKDIPYKVIKNQACAFTLSDEDTRYTSEICAALVGEYTGSTMLEKSVVFKPANGKYYEYAEQVEFVFTLTNDTNQTITDIEFFDILELTESKQIGSHTSLAPGESFSFSFFYTVTGLDCDFGVITNFGWATYKDESGNTVTVNSNTVTVPTNEGEPKLKLVKSVISDPDNGKFYVENEKVEFKLEFVNNTENDFPSAELYDILYDVYNPLAVLGVIGSGATVTDYMDYYITEQDVNDGSVTNIGWLHLSFGPREDVYIISNEVTVPTGKETPVVHEGDCCVPTLTAKADGAGAYEIHYCREHSPLAFKTEELLSGKFGERELAALKRSWTRKAEALYDKWAAAAGDDADIVNADREAFFAAVDAYEKSTGDGASAVRMLENRAAELCYALGLAPADRKDSMTNSVKAYRMIASSTCRENYKMILEAGGKAIGIVKDVLDEDHLETAKNAWARVEEADAADFAEAWVQNRLVWQTALDQLTNISFAMAGQEARPLVMADRQAFDALLKADAQAWALFYPDSAVPAEFCAREMMERVIALCGVMPVK